MDEDPVVKRNLTYGLHAVRMLLEHNPLQVLELWVLDSRCDALIQGLCALAARHGVHVERVSRKTLNRLTSFAAHQGVVACHRATPGAINNVGALLERLDETTLILMLDGVTDPHNLGACLRNADATAVAGVVIPRSRGVGLTASARKVASGAAESVPVISVANLARTIDVVKDAGVVVVGTADDAPDGLYDIDLRGPHAFVLGAEERGLRRLTREKCDRLLKIPMRGTLSSLNVASASAVLLYEARRQQSVAV